VSVQPPEQYYGAPGQFSPVEPQQPRQKSGCLKWGITGCVVALVVGVLGFVGIFFFAIHWIKAAAPYSEAVHRAESDPRVTAALGSPVKASWFLTGNIDAGSQGKALLDIPISGPNARATLHVEAHRSGGPWTFTRMTVTPEKGAAIDLLSK
jgi:hypothetical protein